MQNKEIPKYYRLLGHPFSLSIMKNEKIVSAPLSAQATRAYQSGKNPKFSFTPEMVYHFNVNQYFIGLISTVERIEYVPIFLRRFPHSKFFNENNISLHKWVTYHYINFLIMSVSLYDISLLLTNEIFRLGFKPKSCNEDNIAKNKYVEKTSVKISLDKLDEAIDEYRDLRNLFVHRGRTPTLGPLDKFEFYSFLQKSEKELGIDNTMPDISNPLSNPIILRDLYKNDRRKLVIQIEQKTNNFIDLLLELFSSQKPIYDAYCQTMDILKQKASPTND